MEISLKQLAANWKSALVARSEVGTFTGGTISPRYIANLDARGCGPRGRIRISRKVVYKAAELVRWLEGRSKVIE